MNKEPHLRSPTGTGHLEIAWSNSPSIAAFMLFTVLTLTFILWTTAWRRWPRRNNCSELSVGHSEEITMEAMISPPHSTLPPLTICCSKASGCMHIVWIMIIAEEITLILNADQNSLEERRISLFDIGRLIGKERHPWTYLKEVYLVQIS